MRLSRCTRWLLPALMFLLLPIASFAGVLISVTVAPPPLPVYEQPLCPEEGWMWVPGYWAWGDDGYYWVPGDWVPAPYTGALWTPPWWGWDDGRYIYHDGYWGDEVGYYGGIDYGYGYMGVGFVGGEWRGDRFAYNTAVMRVNTTIIHNTYVNQNVVRERTVVNDRHIAYSGGPGGIRHDPTPTERAAMNVRHTAPTPVQMQHVQAARSDRTLYAKANGGHPQTLATPKPLPMMRQGETTRPGATARPGEPAGTVRGRETNRPEAPGRTAPAPQPNPRTTEPRRTPYSEPRPPSSRTEPQPAPRTETPRTEPRTQPRTEPRPAPEPRPETRPTRPQSEPRPEPQPQPRTTERPQTEPRAVAPPRSEPRPQAEPRPAPMPREETRPAPRPESRPAPQRESRPAPEARPAPQRESRPAPPPKQEKPQPEPHL
jgi:hypothetical protein